MESRTEFECRRCQTAGAAPLPAPPWPGEQGEQIAAGTCRACWQAWQQQQTKVLNELHLNLVNPEHAELLDKHMLVYLGLLDAKEAGLEEAPYAFGERPPQQQD